MISPEIARTPLANPPLPGHVLDNRLGYLYLIGWYSRVFNAEQPTAEPYKKLASNSLDECCIHKYQFGFPPATHKKQRIKLHLAKLSQSLRDFH